MAFRTGWSHKWPIAINADSVISSPVADWPCLVTDAHIPAGAWALMQADGSDLRFSSDEAGRVELYYDDPRLDVAGQSAHLYVRVPSLSSTGATTIWAWVGNSEATAPSAASKQNTYPSSIAAWWPMEEGSGTTVGDRTSNGNDGTLVNGPTWEEAGPTGNAIRFASAPTSGDVQYIQVPAGLAYPNSGWTILTSCLRRTAGLYDYLYSHGIVRATESINLYGESGHWRQTISEFAFNSDDCITNGVWASYVWAYSGSNVTIYADTAVVADENYTLPTMQPGADLYVGARYDQDALREWNGSIANLAVWHAALTADEIAIHHLMLSDPATWATAGELEAVVKGRPRPFTQHRHGPRLVLGGST